MVAAQLVDDDIRDGETLVRRLDRDRFPVAAAFWYYHPENEKWVLIIGSSMVGERGPRVAYRKLIQSIKRIKKKGFTLHSSRIELVKERDQLPRLFRGAVKTGLEIAGIRFTQNTINGFFIEDAYIYRMI